MFGMEWPHDSLARSIIVPTYMRKIFFWATSCPFSLHSILIIRGIDSDEENRMKSMLNEEEDRQKRVSFTFKSTNCPTNVRVHVLERHIR